MLLADERTTTGIISTDSATAPDDAERVPGPTEDREERVGEQAGDDRRDAGHHVDEEGDRTGERSATVLDQVDRGQQADRHRDDGRRAGHQQGADDGVHGAAALADDVAHRVGEELDVEAGEAVRRAP